MTQDQQVHVIIDNRERKLMELLDKRKDKISYESKQLDVADIVISENTAIERKTGADFIGSIMDNRLFEQLIRLQDVYKNAILILEGLNDDVFESTGMNINAIYGVLAKVSYVLGVAVIPTRNLEDTVIVIERIAYREQVKKGSSVMSRSAPKGMSKKERRSFIIEGLIDSGPKKAKILIDRFKTPYKVIEAIKNTEILYTRTGNPKGINGPLKKLQGFGWKFVQKNKEILFGKTSTQKTLDDL